MRRQPEIGSALGLTTDEVVERSRVHGKVLVELRGDLISALAAAMEALNRREAPIDVALRLHGVTEGMLSRWRS